MNKFSFALISAVAVNAQVEDSVEAPVRDSIIDDVIQALPNHPEVQSFFAQYGMEVPNPEDIYAQLQELDGPACLPR